MGCSEFSVTSADGEQSKGEPPTKVSCTPRKIAFGSKFDILI